MLRAAFGASTRPLLRGKAPKSYASTLSAWMEFVVSAKPVVDGDDASANLPRHRVEFELWGKTCPMAVENFARCCLGDMVLPNSPAHESLENDPSWKDTLSPQLTYEGTILHRVVPGFLVQGGDVGLEHPGGPHETVSVFGTEFDAPEELNQHKFNAKGLLGTAVTAPHKNTTQFFVLLAPTASHLDGTCVCFGRVTKGLEFLEGLGAPRMRLQGESPVTQVRCISCGLR